MNRRKYPRIQAEPLILPVLVLLTSACGGGGGGSSDAPPEPEAPEPISLIDSIPAANTSVDASTNGFNLIHFGSSDWRFTYEGECGPSGVAIRHTLTDLSDSTQFSEVIDHKLNCDLRPSTDYELQANTTASDGQRLRASLRFASGSDANATGVTILDTSERSRGAVNRLYARFVREAALNEIGNPVLAALAASIVAQLARFSLDELGDERADYGTLSERVTYQSSAPSGEAATLSGLVVRPRLLDEASFVHPNRVVLLNHGTGSTPSDMEITDVFVLLANLLAGRGYLVLAPDNWGRGEGDGTQQPETYLLANRVAKNSWDMLSQVLADARYSAFHSAQQEVEVSIIGYSQGAHSALGLWLAHAASTQDTVVSEVYAGAGPYDLYRSIRGGLEHLAGRCDGTSWCRDVDGDSALRYAGLILASYFQYTETELALSDVRTGDELSQSFLTGMLDNEPEYDTLKALFQLNSFTNIANLVGSLPASSTRIHLFHAGRDKLVPRQNSLDLADTLMPAVDVALHSGECNGNLFDQLARIGTGVVHAICALEVFDRAMRGLRSLRAGGESTPTRQSDPAAPWRTLAELHASEALGNQDNLKAVQANLSAQDLRAMSEHLRALDSQAAIELATRLDSRIEDRSSSRPAQ